MRKHPVDAELGQRVKRRGLRGGRQLVEGHVERDREAFLLGEPHEPLGEAQVDLAVAEAAEDDAVHPQLSCVPQVIGHDARLGFGVHEVAAARPDHAHHRDACRPAHPDRRADHPVRRRRPADGQVVAQLDAPCAGRDRRRDVLDVLRAELAQQLFTHVTALLCSSFALNRARSHKSKRSGGDGGMVVSRDTRRRVCS